MIKIKIILTIKTVQYKSVKNADTHGYRNIGGIMDLFDDDL